jgi:hypothetical protein
MGGGGKGGEMTQRLYAHTNKRKKFLKIYVDVHCHLFRIPKSHVSSLMVILFQDRFSVFQNFLIFLTDEENEDQKVTFPKAIIVSTYYTYDLNTLSLFCSK